MVTERSGDSELLRRFREKGDRAALSLLFERHRALAYRVALGVLASPPDAEDAAQDAFLRLIRFAPRVRAEGSLAGLVARMALRAAQDLARSAARRRMREAGAAVSADAAGSDGLEALVLQDLQSVVRRAVAELPESCRVPVVLCYFEGLSAPEAAQALGISHAAVRKRLSRAVARLRGQLARDGRLLPVPALITLLETRPAEAVPVTLAARLEGVAAAASFPAAPAGLAALAMAPLGAKLLAFGLVGALFVGGATVIQRMPPPPGAQATPGARRHGRAATRLPAAPLSPRTRGEPAPGRPVPAVPGAARQGAPRRQPSATSPAERSSRLTPPRALDTADPDRTAGRTRPGPGARPDVRRAAPVGAQSRSAPRAAAPAAPDTPAPATPGAAGSVAAAASAPRDDTGEAEPGISLERQVVDQDGRPVAGAQVYGASFLPDVGSWPRRAELREAVTDAEGRFPLEDLRWPMRDKRGRSHPVLVVTPGYALAGDAVPAIRLAPAATWRAIVRDHLGQPVPGCPVRLQSVLLNFSGEPAPERLTLDMVGAPGDPNPPPAFQSVFLHEAFAKWTTRATDELGQVSFDNVPRDGAVGVIVRHADYAVWHNTYLRVNEAEPAELVLQPGGKIAGRVVMGATGKPYPALRVMAAPADPLRSSWGEAVTDARGEFSLTNLADVRHNVLVDFPPDFRWTAAAAAGVEVKPGETTGGIELKLVEGGFVAGVVTDARTGKPLAGVHVGFHGPARPRSSGTIESAITDAEGRYRHRLPPGRNWVYKASIVEGYSSDQKGRWVEVKAGQTTEVDLGIQPGSSRVNMDAFYAPKLADADVGQAIGLPLGTALFNTGVRPAGVTNEPPMPKGRRQYVTLRLGAPPREFHVLLDESQGEGTGYDTLRADTDGDGDLSRERSVPADARPFDVTFPAVTFTCRFRGEPRPIAILIRGSDADGDGVWEFTARPAGSRHGNGTPRAGAAVE